MNERPSKNGGMNGQIGGGGMNECHEVTDERMNDPTDNYVLENVVDRVWVSGFPGHIS